MKLGLRVAVGFAVTISDSFGFTISGVWGFWILDSSVDVSMVQDVEILGLR